MSGPPTPSTFRSYGMTDIGRKRTDNQDQFLIAELRKSMFVKASSLPVDQNAQLFGGARGELLVVADGMGGHAAGQKASSVALNQLISQLLNTVHWFLQVEHDCEEDFIDSLRKLLQQAHTRILSEAAENRSQRGMGTTLTMAHVVWPRMYVVHAGDTRCYLIREGKCQQLTTDHTLAEQLVQSGGVTREEEKTSRWSNVLWNVLGGSGDQELIAEVTRTDLREGDTILLCSDGLTRYVSPELLTEIVSEHGIDVETACQRLVGLANQSGGDDNITVIVSRPSGETTCDDASIVQTQVPFQEIILQSQPDKDHDSESDLLSRGDRNKPLPSGFADEDTLPE